MRISLLVAVSENGVIGHEGELPWRLPDELKLLKQLTMGHTLLMGRKTYESISRPLPGRTSIVVSRNPDFAPHPEVITVASVREGFERARASGESELFVFGGEAIYAEALPQVERLHLTRVHAEVSGDARFPELEPSDWILRDEVPHAADDRHAHAFTFQTFDRKSGPSA